MSIRIVNTSNKNVSFEVPAPPPPPRTVVYQNPVSRLRLRFSAVEDGKFHLTIHNLTDEVKYSRRFQSREDARVFLQSCLQVVDGAS